MCTAATYLTHDFYFGRTLDYEFSYGDEVVVIPRAYPLRFRHAGESSRHYAIIGMAYVAGGDPLLYDGVNEKGLGMAGLNFVGNACYYAPREERDNVAQFEFIPWVLSQCATLEEARALLARVNVLDEGYSPQLPVAQLHWLIADRTGAIVVECMRDGMKIYDNPVGVMTNNPPFDQQLLALSNYMALSPRQPENHWGIPLTPYSRGMGAMGLPGDLSSQSRFVRVAYTKMHALSGSDELSSMSQFFHILGSVDQQRGCCEVREGEYEITLYTSCCNATRGIYYYTTYDNHQITAVDMHLENLEGDALSRYPTITGEQIRLQNAR